MKKRSVTLEEYKTLVTFFLLRFSDSVALLLARRNDRAKVRSRDLSKLVVFEIHPFEDRYSEENCDGEISNVTNHLGNAVILDNGSPGNR